jgi:hypothetical protein
MLAVFAVGYGAAPLSVANGNFQRAPGLNLALILAFTAFIVVGAVIVAHRPGNAVGWIFSAVGLLSSTGVLAMEYAEYAYVTRPGSLPGALLAARWWISASTGASTTPPRPSKPSARDCVTRSTWTRFRPSCSRW